MPCPNCSHTMTNLGMSSGGVCHLQPGKAVLVTHELMPVYAVVGLCAGCVLGLALWGRLVRDLTRERDGLEAALREAYGTIDRLTRPDANSEPRATR